MKQYDLKYRGYIQGLVGVGSQAVFITDHSEQFATELYRVDFSKEQPSLQSEVLPCGATALTHDDKHVWFVGDDGLLYQAGLEKGKPKALSGLSFADSKVLGLAVLAQKQLAVLQSNLLSIVDLSQKRVVQTIEAEQAFSCLASSPDGLWLAVGDQKGQVQTYQQRDQQWLLSAKAVLHDAEVTALQFEQHELRFYSAGADRKLLSTHAQGALQALDKGKSSHHQGVIQTLHLGKERLFTGADDKTLKAWAYSGGQPVTLKEGLSKVLHSATVNYQGRDHLLVAGSDSSLRLVTLTTDEKFGEIRCVIKDGYQWANDYLHSATAKERQLAVDLLAQYDDKKALNRLEKQLKREQDKAQRVAMVQVFAHSKHTYALNVLETALADKKHDTVRMTAFDALVKRAEKADLHPFKKALATGFVEVGMAALEHLLPLAKKSQAAQALLVEALNHNAVKVRTLALSYLEKVYPKTSAQASLQALNSTHLDIQRAALIRLFQRQLLNDFAVKQALLLAQDHNDDILRHTAFLVSILSQPELSKALKTREPDLARQLQELEDFDLLQDKRGEAKEKPSKTTRQSSLSRLEETDYRILLQGMSNQHADICFSAAFALAVLQDQRAFGLLILLSQENDASIRAGVCRAFAWLEQTDSIPQLELMLNDGDALVRDAAFTALAKVHTDALAVAAYGLHSQHQDIHARALKILLENFDTKPKKAQVSALKSLLNSFSSKHQQSQSPALNLLHIALNDPFEAIRQETTKACLNRQLGGDLQKTIELLQQGHYEDVHNAALKELFAQHAQNPRPTWVESSIVAQLNDTFAQIRKQALHFILKEKKHFDLKKALHVAVQSRFVDVRESVFSYLKQNQSKENQKHLQLLVDDEVDTLRHQALDALIGKLHYDSLHKALKSQYDDIRVKAAYTLARNFESLPEVYNTLTQLLQRAEPEKSDDYKHWVKTSGHALEGLHNLADSRAFDLVVSFLQHKEDKLAKSAANALPWVSQVSHKPKLVELQSDERKFVKVNASYALALLGQAEAKTLFNNQKLMKSHIDDFPLLAAQLCLSTPTPSNLQTYLLDNNTRLSALFILASYELLQHDTPQLLNGALSIANPEVQLFCADLMTRFADRDACWEYLQNWLLNIQHEHNHKWQVSITTIKTMAHILVYGDGKARKYLLDAMSYLDQYQKPESLQLRFDSFIQGFAQRFYAHPIVDKAIEDKPDTHAWQQRAFGAYLGVVRQSNYAGYWGHQLITQRLKALRAMVQLAQANTAMHASVNSCLLTLLNHEQTQIRNFAFEQLKGLGMDLELLGNTATTSLQTDIAKQGLELLIAHYPIKQSRSLLTDLIQGNNELLAYEAYDLHCEHIGLLETVPFALQAYSESLRIRSVKDVSMQYEDSKSARSLLLEACQNDRVPVALGAAAVLSQHQHPQAYDILSGLLSENTQAHQQQVIVRLLGELKDNKVACLLLDYLRHNKLCRVEDRHIFQQINRYRATTLFQPLLEFLEEKPSVSRSIIQALVNITGFDQDMPDFDEKRSNQTWRKDLYPFHDELLVQLFSQLLALKYYSQAAHLWQAMAWVQEKSADQALANASMVVAEDELPYIVQAMAYRVEKREGAIEGLLKLLTHKSQNIQLLAAEALANNGHDQGFSVLLAAMDYQEDGDLRQRAVLALGKLADERALDKLLKLAQDEEHFLSDVAIEAIGHMGQSDEADKILKLIKARLNGSDNYYSEAWKNALNGLRWFNRLNAWQTVLASLNHSYWLHRVHAAELLRYWDSEASREALLKALHKERDDDVVEMAYHSLQLLLKPDQTEVSEADIALLQGHHPDAQEHVMEHVKQYASTAQLLALISADFADEDYAQSIPQSMAQALLMRDDLSLVDLEQGLGSKRLVVIEVMAKLLMKVDTLNEATRAYLMESFDDALEQWEKLSAQLLQGEDYTASERKVDYERVLTTLIWTHIQHQVFSPRLLRLLQTEDKRERDFQLSLLKALLAQDKLSDPSIINALESLHESGLSEVRTLVDQVLVQNGKTGTHWQHFLNQPEALQDFNQAAAYQAQVLPLLIQNEDVSTLQQIAQDEQHSEAIRLGAIEGLARILNEAAHTALSQLHKSIKDKDMSKGAYKALRRQQRSRAKADQLNAKVGA